MKEFKTTGSFTDFENKRFAEVWKELLVTNDIDLERIGYISDPARDRQLDKTKYKEMIAARVQRFGDWCRENHKIKYRGPKSLKQVDQE